jgi:hypothetical protein
VNVTFASELLDKGLWYPTILGVLVVVAGIALFVGSIYVLLGTNLGARLGFLVTFTGLMGFMTILTLLWCTTASPLNTLKGRIPAWKVKEVVMGESLEKSKIADVRDIGQPKNRVKDASEVANVKAAVDAALVPKIGTPTAPVEPEDNRFAIQDFEDVTKYQILETYEIGGSSPQFWKGQFTHTPQFAAVQFCQNAAAPVDRPNVLPPIPPECATDGVRGYVILERDLGSLRVPPFVAFGMSLILFVLGLLMLHWREKDEMAAAEEKRPTPAPEPARVPAKV